ncbi:MAG: hypothetical protein GX444_17235 [Myxococcales bacterium]|nr:hypothetical protein [Myxococcales bacterium]
MKSPASGIRRRVAAFVFGLILALLLGELSLRWFVPAPSVTRVSAGLVHLSDDLALRYELTPFGTDGKVAINGEGRRDFHYPQTKEPTVFRLALLGDSVTFAAAVPLAETFAKRLEYLLNRFQASPRIRFEVWNYAVPGYGIREEARCLESKVGRDRPDLVLLAYCLNDPDPFTIDLALLYQNLKAADKRRIGRLLGAPSDFGSVLVERSRLLQLVAPLFLPAGHRAAERQANEYIRGFWEADRRSRESNRSRSYQEYVRVVTDRNWSAVESGMRQLRSFAEANRIAAGVVIFPVLWHLPNYDLQPVHERVAAAAEKEGLPVLDLLRLFQDAAVRLRWPDEPPDPIHPDLAGNRLAGAGIAAWLVRRNLLPIREADMQSGFFELATVTAAAPPDWWNRYDMLWLEQAVRQAAAGRCREAQESYAAAVNLNPAVQALRPAVNRCRPVAE